MNSAESSSTSSTTDDAIEVGRVGRAHGLGGAFYVTRPTAGLLEVGAELTVAGGARTIERRAGTVAKPILEVTGCASREQADALRGEPLWVAHAALPELGEGEYWPHQLVGCRVVGADGRDVGEVAQMVALPSCEALEVDGRLIPLVQDAVRSVDVAARRIEVDVAFLGDV